MRTFHVRTNSADGVTYNVDADFVVVNGDGSVSFIQCSTPAKDEGEVVAVAFRPQMVKAGQR